MPELFFDPKAGEVDYLFGILLFCIGTVLISLLLPVPRPKRPSAPTEDTTKTRRVK